jgi:preprotein translocase subunit Sec63
VLGVPRDTSPERIRAAYEQARLKYSEDTVAHLGADVQEHFRAKAEAVDRAYQMLAG